MRQNFLKLLLFLFALHLTACDQNTIIPGQFQKNDSILSAEELDLNLGGKCAASGAEYTCSSASLPGATIAEENKTVYDKKTYIAMLVSDSQKKCGDFTRHLSESESRSGSPGLASAIGTALPQMNAINAVANASGFKGMNNNEDSETYARKNITNYVQAIRINYGGRIKKYIDTIESKDDAKINVAIEINNLRLIHGLCSLNAAQSFISERLSDTRSQQALPEKPPAIAVENTLKSEMPQ